MIHAGRVGGRFWNRAKDDVTGKQVFSSVYLSLVFIRRVRNRSLVRLSRDVSLFSRARTFSKVRLTVGWDFSRWLTRFKNVRNIITWSQWRQRLTAPRFQGDWQQCVWVNFSESAVLFVSRDNCCSFEESVGKSVLFISYMYFLFFGVIWTDYYSRWEWHIIIEIESYGWWGYVTNAIRNKLSSNLPLSFTE